MDDLPDLVRRASRALQQMTREAAEPHGLSPHQVRALSCIVDLGSARPSDVAEHLRIAPRSATEVLDGLAGAGLVERRPHPDDRRATLVEPTAEGTRLLRVIQCARDREADAYFARLTATERAELARLLTRLGDRSDPGA